MESRTLDGRIDDELGIPVNRAIESFTYSWRSDPQDEFARNKVKRLLSEHEGGYTGDDPSTMLWVYDILGENSDENIELGIRGFEGLERDPKTLSSLENPDLLVQYAISTTDESDLDYLVDLQDAIIASGHFFPKYFDGVVDASKNLISGLLLVAGEIDNRLRFVDKQVLDRFEGDDDEYFKLESILKTRTNAYAALVLAHQAENPIGEDTLDSLAAYEALFGRYDFSNFGRVFTDDLLGAYAERKYGLDAPSTGETPEELKINTLRVQKNLGDQPFFFDDEFRARIFGVRSHGRARQQTSQDDGTGQVLDAMASDPWSQYSHELELLGLGRDMPYEEAKKLFRGGIMGRRSTFIRQDKTTPGYESAMKETASYLDAWRKVEPLFKNLDNST